jgi:pantoate--beta-alanine ligase
MQTVTTIDALRSVISDWRKEDLRVAFVPTMGNLHAGHIKLIETARNFADRVVVSIFVNPTQFGPNEDFASYPRTEQQDQEKLQACGADLLFLPFVAEMYPQPNKTLISVTHLASIHCGASRPGHFDGVALVVCKLLNMVSPDVLLLGVKDFQQLAVIRQMVSDLNMSVTIHGVPTVREVDGLAMSSRNGYLSATERQIAPMLYQVLCQVRQAILSGVSDYQALLFEQVQRLQQADFTVDYFQVCRQDDLLPAAATDLNLVILIAAKLGKTRLIDNIHFSRPTSA